MISLEKLSREFYARDAVTVARELLGKLLVHDALEGRTSGYIVEAEAYVGPLDRAAHSYGGKMTRRNRAMFGPPGHAYIYLIYGMYDCFNVVTAEEGSPQAVLIRALEPFEGLELMRRRRGTHDPRKLTSGPGRLTQAMGITRELYGVDLLGDRLYLTAGREVSATEVLATPRINVDYAGEWKDRPWRFVVRDSRYLSA